MHFYPGQTVVLLNLTYRYSIFALVILLAAALSMVSISKWDSKAIMKTKIATARYLSGEHHIIVDRPVEFSSEKNTIQIQVDKLNALRQFETPKWIISVQSLPFEVIVNVDANLLFIPVSSDLNEGAKAFLRQLHKNMMPGIKQIVVEGHTDNVPIKGSDVYKTNWELSALRATAVVRELNATGVPASLLLAKAYGDTHPLQKSDDPKARYANRRVTIRLFWIK